MEKIFNKIKNLFRKKIYIKYHSKDMKKLNLLTIGDWIDLRADSIKLPDGRIKTWKLNTEKNDFEYGKFYYEYKKGDHILVNTAISMQLPKGYEAYVLPRSSTYRNYKLLLTNSMGLIDNSYNGNNDIWLLSFVALEDGRIYKGDRLAQFRIQKKMPTVEFIEVEDLGNKDRGGFGSTGTK